MKTLIVISIILLLFPMINAQPEEEINPIPIPTLNEYCKPYIELVGRCGGTIKECRKVDRLHQRDLRRCERDYKKYLRSLHIKEKKIKIKIIELDLNLPIGIK